MRDMDEVIKEIEEEDGSMWFSKINFISMISKKVEEKLP